MNELVQLITNDDGDPVWESKWCLIDPSNPCGVATLCTGEFIGDGESACTYETKSTKRGGITCEKCLLIIKEYKAVKL